MLESNAPDAACIGSVQWNAAMIYDAVSRFCVPMFLMISGALFLGRPLRTKRLYQKYIFRIVLAYLFWSLIYVLLKMDFSIRGLLVGTLSGGPRFYFLCLIIGMYMMTPLLNKLVESQNALAYFLVLCFFFGFLEPQIFNMLGNRQIPYVSLLVELIHQFVEKMELTGLTYIPAYYVLGYVLFHDDIKPQYRKALYLMGILGTIITICCSIWESVLTDTLVTYWLSYSSVNVLCMTVGLFVFAKYELSRISCSQTFASVVGYLAKYTFCIYLIHSWVLDSFLPNVVGISANSWDAWFFIPAITLFVFVMSLLISSIVNQIPVLNRYIA